MIDRFVLCEVFLARLKLAQGDVAGAAALLAEAAQSARQQNFVYRMPEVAAAQVLTLLHQGSLSAAAQLAQAHELPLSYVYADVLTLYFNPVLQKEATKQLLSGYVGSLQITQGFVLVGAVLLATAIAMVLLSRVLKYRANRWANITVGVLQTASVAWSWPGCPRPRTRWPGCH